MNAAFVCCECKDEQNEHHDEDDALFVFGELENPEETFHLLA
jgi:hypothetical protein